MNIKNINKVITTSGNTADIIHTVMIAYEQDDDQQIAELAKELKGDDIRETCRNIWSYLIEKVDYRADAETGLGEMIRTPARLIHDGTGDCKSYSLFTAVVLRYLGIKHFFRFVSYSSRPEATHVYIIALDEQENEICIDAVAYEMKKIDFDNEIKYTYKADMANGTTKISYLAGLGDSPIGQVDEDDDIYNVWLGDEPETNLTLGKMYLYVQADLLSEQLKTSDDTATAYNRLALIVALIHAYNYVYGDTWEFDNMVRIIAGMKREGWFGSRETDTTLRDEWFDQLTAEIELRYSNEMQPAVMDEEFYKIITENVTNQNGIIDSISGISGLNPLTTGLKKAGIYFLYLFIPETELKKYPAAVAKKRKTQNTFYTLIHKIDIFHNAQQVKDLFRSGIIARTGMEPEKLIETLKKENVKNVGAITVATLMTISTIIGIVIGLLEIIRMIWPKSEAANYAVSSGAADVNAELYTVKTQGAGSGSGTSTGSGASLKTILTMGGIAAAGFFLIGKIKK